MRVTRSSLVDAMQGGCQTVQALSARTGAGTVCGGCLPQLAELTAETLWQTVRCLEVIDRAPRVRSFRLEVPVDQRVGTKPGQRVVIRAAIGGVDMHRCYTLTSAATERDYYEITVQREPNGAMSGWLFDNLRPGATLAILPPSGTCFFELAEPRPPLLDRLQAMTAYKALTGSGLLVLLLLQWHLGYVRWRNRAQETSRAYGLHVATGPAVLGMIWLHSTHLGYALSMAVCLSFLASLATGAVLGAHPRSPRWDSTRRVILSVHIIMSCAGSGFAVTHGFTALWY